MMERDGGVGWGLILVIWVFLISQPLRLAGWLAHALSEMDPFFPQTQALRLSGSQALRPSGSQAQAQAQSGSAPVISSRLSLGSGSTAPAAPDALVWIGWDPHLVPSLTLIFISHSSIHSTSTTNEMPFEAMQ
ncbi:hypothetical protein MBM_08539 [Drepanopeziza brunnea f. sp. 'multigermtubi' MB_m1]|uniref:Uncharacterized protein n=1 Tax=Marssonina brunnea f. sp. multigermtubi (strain MB_m1) TaxID=1072389 RepID=K1WJS8_MARBU|nr:uncharacterized protein MBM_08539 [Drepanopeziza brunnea f. sp. 'multigermtubi' MB_m1]EKD13096.1 hypothetical protein MBM_08539 [Drepanopeziza brunnea f. sp. 'multigermtubi' MB_m1]